MNSQPKLKDYYLDNEKVSFYKRINLIKSEKYFWSFILFVSILITMSFFCFIELKTPEHCVICENGILTAILLVWWVSACGVLLLFYIPFVNILIFQFNNIFNKAYSAIKTSKKDMELAEYYEVKHKEYLSDEDKYNQFMQEQKDNLLKEENERIEKEKALLRYETLKDDSNKQGSRRTD